MKIDSLNFMNVLPMPGYHMSSKRGILAKDGYEIVPDVENQRYLITWVHPQSGMRSATFFAHFSNCAGGIMAEEKAKVFQALPDTVPVKLEEPKPAKPKRKPAPKPKAQAVPEATP